MRCFFCENKAIVAVEFLETGVVMEYCLECLSRLVTRLKEAED